MTYEQFRSELTQALPALASRPPDANPVDPAWAADWPYHADYFNQP
jgi:hypothetical protein